jgi:hypothetical protein
MSTAGLALALSAAPGAAFAGSMGGVQLYNCSTLAAKPTEIVLSCADANRSLEKIHWHTWGGKSATATATLTWNTCTPNCASGKDKSKVITFTATDRKTVKGELLYTELVGPAGTWGEKGTVWALPTSKE